MVPRADVALLHHGAAVQPAALEADVEARGPRGLELPLRVEDAADLPSAPLRHRRSSKE